MSDVEATVVFGLMLVIALRVCVREMRETEENRPPPVESRLSATVDSA